jgi:hypothetical protein
MNEGKSAASYYRQVAAWVQVIFYSFNLVKNHKTAKNLTTTNAREKNKNRFGILRILVIFYIYFTKFKNNQILLNKISHRFLMTTKLFTGQKSLIQHIF